MRHSKIRNHEVEVICLERRKRLLAIGGDSGLIPFVAQYVGQALSARRFVIYDENIDSHLVFGPRCFEKLSQNSLFAKMRKGQQGFSELEICITQYPQKYPRKRTCGLACPMQISI
jgi:hypothetical protein